MTWAILDNESEFTCSDCGAEVIALGLWVCPLPPLCATCAWLVEYQDDPLERERVRAAIEGRESRL